MATCGNLLVAPSKGPKRQRQKRPRLPLVDGGEVSAARLSKRARCGEQHLCRRCDRRETLICHASLESPLPIALLATAVCLSAVLALLIAVVSVVSLSTSGCGSTCRAAVALATVATDADGEYRPTLRVATYSEPKNSIHVNPGIMPQPPTEVWSFEMSPAWMIGKMIRAFGADDVAGSGRWPAQCLPFCRAWSQASSSSFL
jgi:hypothetical protein